MADFVQCPQCGLKHSRRPEGLCPRCQNAVDGAAAPAPAAAQATSPAPIVEPLKVREAQAPPVTTAGSRAAGILLFVNALLVIGSILVMPAQSGPFQGLHGGVIADVVIGIGLFTGRASWHKWAFVRALLGGLLFGGMYAAQGDFVSVALQATLSGSLVLLLAGHPGPLRIGAAFALSAPYLLLATVGLVSSRSGVNPVSAAVMSARGDISPASGTVQGTKLDYCVQVPAKSWYLRTEAAAHKDNPLADRWLIRPDLDAHVMIIAEEVPGATITQDRFEDAIAREAKQRLTQFHLVERDDLGGGAALHYTGKLKDLDLEYYRGAFAEGSRAYQVVAFATPQHFARVSEEVSGIVRSFRSHCATTEAASK